LPTLYIFNGIWSRDVKPPVDFFACFLQLGNTVVTKGTSTNISLALRLDLKETLLAPPAQTAFSGINASI
jgi:hypothetical protein